MKGKRELSQEQSPRSILVALGASAALHLLAVGVYVHAWPGGSTASSDGGSAAGIDLRLMTAVNAGEPGAGEQASGAEQQAASTMPSSPDLPAFPADLTAPPEGLIAPDRPSMDNPSATTTTARNLNTSEAWSLQPPGLASVDLNPVPRLIEPYDLALADLGQHRPMKAHQKRAMTDALEYAETHLAELNASSEPLVWQQGGDEYQVRLEQQAPRSATDLGHAVLAVTTKMNGLEMTARLPAKRVAFSHYAQVVDRWNPDVSLASDRIIGRFHSNSRISVEADQHHSPLVTGKTTVAGGVQFGGDARAHSVFPNGLATGAQRLPLPDNVVDWASVTLDETRIERLHEDAHVEFLADGSYRWRPIAGGGIHHTVSPAAEPWLLIADEGVTIEVQGVVSGSYLVYSPKRVTVSGSLRYAHDPRQGNSADYLGLVSDGYVEIAGPETTGSGDLDVQAVVFAGRQFRVRHYRSKNGGTLRIFGSVTAGSLSATEPRFSTVLEFDHRLERQRPAYFPLTNHYVFEDFEPEWTVQRTAALE